MRHKMNKQNNFTNKNQIRKKNQKTNNTKKEKLFHLNKRFEKDLNETQVDLISSIPEILLDVSKISEKHFAQIKKNVFELFKQLTSERSERYANYLNSDAFVFAYAYYYLPWNCYKLVKLFLHLSLAELLAEKNKEEENKIDELVFADFGAGPLTTMLALWIAEPKLRAKKIVWYCFDISNKVLDLGEKIFKALENKNKKNAWNWTIKKIQASFGIKQSEDAIGENIKPDFYFSCNMFNEFINPNSEKFLDDVFFATERIEKYLGENSFALIVEPGNPQGGKIISAFRQQFLQTGFAVSSPCTHSKPCPLDENLARIFFETNLAGKKIQDKDYSFARGKWCHFIFSAKENIESLNTLSEKVNLPKEKIALAYLLVSKNKMFNSQNEKKNADTLQVRIISEMIKLRGAFGRYACSEHGFVLLKTENKNTLKGFRSGDIISLNKTLFKNSEFDRKTKAKIVQI